MEFRQGEFEIKVKEMKALFKETYGREPKPEEILAIKNAIYAGEGLPPPIEEAPPE